MSIIRDDDTQGFVICILAVAVVLAILAAIYK